MDRPGPLADLRRPLTLRVIVRSGEAGAIIGKGSKNVADLREETSGEPDVGEVAQSAN